MRRIRILPIFVVLASFAVAENRFPERVYDLINVNWNLSLTDTWGQIQGDVTNTLAPLRDGVRSLPFQSARLTIMQVTVDGAKADWSQNGDTLNVRLKSPGKKGKAMKVRIVYSGRPESGIYFVSANHAWPSKTPMVYTQGEMEDNRFWIPTWDYPNDKATSEGIIQVPKGWFALSNGRLLDSKSTALNTTYHWKMEQPHSTYLIALVAGPYSEGRETWDGIPVLYYVPVGLETWGRAAFGGTNRMVQFYSELTGVRYPYAKFSQSAVSDFMFGGMENVTMVTNTITALYPPEEKPFSNAEGLVLHELAHQWFGDLITCVDWSHVWLNEGFASFLPSFYDRKFHGDEQFDFDRYFTLKGAFESATSSKYPMIRTEYKDPIDVFDGNAYGGGAARMFMLMRKVGERAFWNGIKDYLRQYGFKNVNTDEFFASMENSTGANLESFKKQWFLVAGAPKLTLTRKGDNLVITQTAPMFDLDTELWILDKDKWVEKAVAVKGKETTVPLGALAGKPVLLDPQVWVMGTVKYDLNYGSREWTLLYRRAPNAAQKLRILDSLRAIGKTDLIGLLATEEQSPRLLENMVPNIDLIQQDLVLKLSRHPDRLLQRAAVERLGELSGGEASLTRLREVWEKDRSDQMKRSALSSLVKLTGDESLVTIAWGQDSFHDTLRQFALDWWSSHKPDIAREKALEVLKNPSSEALRISAISHLGRLKDKPGEKRVFEALTAVVQEDSINPRSTAIDALKDYGDPAAVAVLEKLKDYGFYGIRNSARDAIESLNKPK